MKAAAQQTIWNSLSYKNDTGRWHGKKRKPRRGIGGRWSVRGNANLGTLFPFVLFVVK
jgi:hypothetical protein